MDCIFCKIASHDIPTDVIFENDRIIAFHDIEKKAPIHFLVIPKKHISSVDGLEKDDENLIGEIFLAIKEIARKLNIAEDGYRVVTNMGQNAGQSVNHIHFHVLGGRELSWPPG